MLAPGDTRTSTKQQHPAPKRSRRTPPAIAGALLVVLVQAARAARDTAAQRQRRQQQQQALHPGATAASSTVASLVGGAAPGIVPRLAPNVSVLPLSPSDGGGGGDGDDGFDIPGLLRNEDSELIARIRNGTGHPPVSAAAGGGGGGRAYARPLPPLRVATGDGAQFGYDADAHAAATTDWGDHCFPLDRCKRCAADSHCGWCAVEATCYAAVGAGKEMCGGGWVTTTEGECPPEPSGAVLLPAMELDTAASRVPFALDNLPGCGGRGGYRLPGDCQKSRLRRAGGVSISPVKWADDGGGLGDGDGGGDGAAVDLPKRRAKAAEVARVRREKRLDDTRRLAAEGRAAVSSGNSGGTGTGVTGSDNSGGAAKAAKLMSEVMAKRSKMHALFGALFRCGEPRCLARVQRQIQMLKEALAGRFT